MSKRRHMRWKRPSNGRHENSLVEILNFFDVAFLELIARLADAEFLRADDEPLKLESASSSADFCWASAPLIAFDEARATFACHSG